MTSDGTTSGSAIVWVTRSDGPTGANGQLCAYNGVPTSGTLKLLRCFPVGTASKFSVPGSGAGRVYVGTRDGKLIGIGAPVPRRCCPSPQTNFGSVNVGSSELRNDQVDRERARDDHRRVGDRAVQRGAITDCPSRWPRARRSRMPATFAPTDAGIGHRRRHVHRDKRLDLDDVRCGAARPRCATRLHRDTARHSTSARYRSESSVSLTENFANTGTNNEKTVSSITHAVGGVHRHRPAAGRHRGRRRARSVAVSVTYEPTDDRLGGLVDDVRRRGRIRRRNVDRRRGDRA